MAAPEQKKKDKESAKPATAATPTAAILLFVDKDGPFCTESRSARLPGPLAAVGTPLAECNEFISAELRDACSMPDIVPGLTGARSKVATWLRANQELIISAETKWLIDRRAIAGVIAWEALYNVKSGKPIRRWEGVGKVHYWDVGMPGAKNKLATAMAWVLGSKVQTTAEQSELSGYLPEVTEEERGKILKTVDGSITYIAAIMRANADVVSELGGYPDDEIYWNPPVLATLYNTKTLEDVKQIYAKKKYPAPLAPGEAMGLWVSANLAFLEDAVGKLPEGCRPVSLLNKIKK
jgi:hypothetical protein